MSTSKKCLTNCLTHSSCSCSVSITHNNVWLSTKKKKISVTLTRIFERRDMIYSRWWVPPSAFHRSPTVCRHATPSSMVFPPIEWNAAIFSVAHWRSAPMSLRSFQAVAFDADNSFRCKQNNSKCSIIFSYRFRWIVQIIIFYEPQWGHIRLPE